MRQARLSRRAFLGSCGAALTAPALRLGAQVRSGPLPGERERPAETLPRMGARLRDRYPDLHRQFIFEYYPWYDATTGRHWNDAERTLPAEIAASGYPLLGPYDSRSARTLEQHARWIKDAGVGAINVSWWGRGSLEDQAVHPIMDVMRAFDIKVTFHLEPYGRERGVQFADDIAYILREYGERRRWDTLSRTPS